MQKLRDQNMPQSEARELTGISERSISRIEKEEQITEIDEERFRKSHNMGRPSRVTEYETHIRQWLEEPRHAQDVPINSQEILARRASAGLQRREDRCL